MIPLNLEAKTNAQKIIKAYLEENASEILADKINNGVWIEKNGKRLLNKKTLDGFMSYASEEAKKVAEKGERSACVSDDVVFGWAIHYFEEDSIEDGTGHNPASKTKPATPSSTVVAPPAPKPKPQMSLFDMLATSYDITHGTDEPNPYRVAKELRESALDSQPEEQDEEDEEPTEEELQEVIEAITEPPVLPPKPKTTVSPMYQNYLDLQQQNSDCILFMRLGDFYEVLGENAVKAAQILDLTLTGKNCGFEERVPMCGIPYHASENYFIKLVKEGYAVAVAENRTTAKRFSLPVTDMVIDEETGEVLSNSEPADDTEDPPFDTSAFDTEALSILDELFNGQITLA